MGSKPFWNSSDPVTPGQLNYIAELQKLNVLTDEDILLLGGVERLEDMTKRAAISVIAVLRKRNVTEVERALNEAQARKESA